MANLNDPRPTSTAFGSVPRAGGQVVFDAGLRKHMLSIYNYMTSGILLTGIVALLAFTSGVAETIFTGGILRWIVALSPMAIVFAMSFGANRFSTAFIQNPGHVSRLRADIDLGHILDTDGYVVGDFDYGFIQIREFLHIA